MINQQSTISNEQSTMINLLLGAGILKIENDQLIS